MVEKSKVLAYIIAISVGLALSIIIKILFGVNLFMVLIIGSILAVLVGHNSIKEGTDQS